MMGAAEQTHDQDQGEATELVVVDRTTGEQIDVRSAEDEQLAEFTENAADLISTVQEADAIVRRELIRRMDRSGSWTRRVGDPAEGVQYEIKAPSPEAGTTDVDRAVLEAELRRLVQEDEIAIEAAEAALRRRMVVTFDLGLHGDQDEFEIRARKDQRVLDVQPSISTVKAGLNALTKIGGAAAEAVVKATVDKPAPTRRATVKAIRKAGGRG